jgi:hypothetical protein
MKNVTRYLNAFAFSVAGAAAHANASAEQNTCGSAPCFQLTPVAEKGSPLLAADGSSRTPQGQMVAENGGSRTPQGQLLDSQMA